MPRPPAKRDNYRGDAIAIHRILSAIEIDPRIDDADKADLTDKLQAVIYKLNFLKFKSNGGSSPKPNEAA
jgi:hypothetical protein